MLSRPTTPTTNTGMISQARFECTKCGDCCVFAPGEVVWVTAEEVAAIERHLGHPINTKPDGDRRSLVPATLPGHAEPPDAGPCELLDPQTKLCSAYPVRPAQCVSYPFWPSILRSNATWQLEALRCEGIGRGELITEEQLLERLKKAPPGV